ncbi:hypothetical protein BLOT_003115 [Blomia tropicalis]|nr:hypothetical protein BLOT_003115 [Blomia tropicalis]
MIRFIENVDNRYMNHYDNNQQLAIITSQSDDLECDNGKMIISIESGTPSIINTNHTSLNVVVDELSVQFTTISAQSEYIYEY